MVEIVQASDVSGGAYFKPADHTSALAIAVEPTELFRDVPNTYKGVTTNRDEIEATVTIFKTSESLEKGEPSAILKGVRLTHPGLVNPASRAIGKVLLGTVGKIPPKQGGSEYWGFRDLDKSATAQVAAYLEKREAELAEALENVPDFG